MVLAGEDRSTGRKICSTSISSARNPTWPDPGLYPGLCGERPMTDLART